jgi:hypothetical protein
LLVMEFTMAKPIIVEVANFDLVDPVDGAINLEWLVPTYEDGSQYIYFYRYDPPCTPKIPIKPKEGFFYPSFGDAVCLNPGLKPKSGPIVTVNAGERLDVVFNILGWPDYPLHPGEPHGLIIKLGDDRKKANRGETEIRFRDVLGDQLEFRFWIEGSAFVGEEALTQEAPYLLPMRITRN